MQNIQYYANTTFYKLNPEKIYKNYTQIYATSCTKLLSRNCIATFRVSIINIL